MVSENMMTKSASVADLDRLEADLDRLEDEIDQALINLIGKHSDDLMIVNLKRRQLLLRDEIEWGRYKAVENGRHNNSSW